MFWVWVFLDVGVLGFVLVFCSVSFKVVVCLHSFGVQFMEDGASL